MERLKALEDSDFASPRDRGRGGSHHGCCWPPAGPHTLVQHWGLSYARFWPTDAPHAPKAEATFTPRLGLPEIPMVMVLDLLMVEELFGHSSTRLLRLGNGSSASTRGDSRSRCKRRHRSRREVRRSSAESIGHGYAVSLIGAAVAVYVVSGLFHFIVMEPLRCGCNKCRVVSLEPLDHRRYISTHCGFVPEQFVIPPCAASKFLTFCSQPWSVWMKSLICPFVYVVTSCSALAPSV